MKWKSVLPLLAAVSLMACNKFNTSRVDEDATTFTEISSTMIGKVGTAEITAYDPVSKKLFIVSNAGTVSQINILDISNPATPVILGAIDITPYGGTLHSVSAYQGKLAASMEGFVKTDPGKVVIFNTTDYSVIKQVQVGPYPDMVTFTNDGKNILTANEGEPNSAYTIDPEGSVSIISVDNDYAVTKVGFSQFDYQIGERLRIFGPHASFAQDIEPEYISVSADSKTAWVTLQENNGIAQIDIVSKRVIKIIGLGYKDYNLEINAMDPSDRDGGVFPGKWPVKGMYQPDGIAVYDYMGTPYLFTANEGDIRDYPGYSEVARVNTLKFDPYPFPDSAKYKPENKMGRLNVTKTLGDAGLDGDYNEFYSFGARSFSVWDGNNGRQVYDSKNELEQKSIEAGRYDDTRSDDKGVEPEVMTLGEVGNKVIAFIGLERANAIVLYDVTNPNNPVYMKFIPSVIGPEGITFIPALQSPTGKTLVVVSSEVDGVIKIYQTQ